MPPSNTDPTGSKADHWFAAYSADHQHPLNRALHQWCVPLILWSLVAVLYLIPLNLSGSSDNNQGSVAFLASVLALVFWFGVLPRWLALAMAGVMLLMLTVSAVLLAWLGTGLLLMLAIAVFVVAWIGQFIGHHIEGKRPSFLTDLVYLLIGPPWVLIKLLDKKTESEGREST
jgi:uncharacterized membrane protein YGL010W